MPLADGLPSEPRIERNLIDMTNREYIDREIAAVRREVEVARIAHERDHDAHATEHLVHAGAHEREHQAATIAITKSEESMLLRFESVNKFREQLERLVQTFAPLASFEQFKVQVTDQMRQMYDQANTFITRQAVEDRMKGVTEKVDNIERVTERSVGRTQGLSLAWGVIVVLISIGIGLLGLR